LSLSILNFRSRFADNEDMKKISAIFILFLILNGLLCAQSNEPLVIDEDAGGVEAGADMTASSVNADSVVASNFRQEGVASWYGAEFAGRATASGEIFDPTQLTAAHADLPFGTYLVVTNINNGKKISVRVNDRGPFVRSRILDVSRAAAERLDMLSSGTAKVVIEATTREGAQAIARELGVGITAQAARPVSAATPTQVPSVPAAPSAQTPVPPAAASRITAAAPTGNASPAAQTSAPAIAPVPSVAASRTTPAAPSGNTASAAQSPATSVPAAAAPSGNPAPAAPSTTAAAPTVVPSPLSGTPVMAATTPRPPTQSPVVVPAPPAAMIPSPSLSRVTGQVENIPEIRRSSEPGYVVVDEQIAAVAPLPNAATASATPLLPVSEEPRTTSQPSTSAPQTASPATAAVAPSRPAAEEPQTAPTAAPPTAPDVTPVLPAPAASAAPPAQENPAASVPVTGPLPGGKVEFSGSPPVQGKNYRVQVGSFADLKNASDVFLRLFDAGLNPSYERFDDKYYRVVITNVKAEDTDGLSRKLAEIGITEALMREDNGN
jgi:rare lipoprotein A (peptidoglycan hydrolase)